MYCILSCPDHISLSHIVTYIVVLYVIVPCSNSFCRIVCYLKAGGDYAFFKIVLGPFTAFLNVWVQFVTVKPTFYAISALTTSNYLLKPFFPHCDMPVIAVKCLSIWILCKYFRYFL